ncbi:hypothetical protein PR202_ga29397 [Eleusine coracana subsp. coracana]|uniref:RING-type E3 ubiquitin transferase n=1 Tax=Eleusine coracana subsp. coracana TaxID=191504 RepID=A0AAV5DL45_ELECO|nr:hypothetical protein PR202_ga29397 [Eleusine coracana subsp. coracana]
MASSVLHSLLLVLGVLLLSSQDTIKPSSSEPLHPAPEYEQAKEDYPRFAEVQRHCRPVLSSASVLADDTHRSGFVKRFLSFEKGDWRQAPGHAPLMPFDDGDDARRRRPPLSLATFMLTHVGEGKSGGQTTSVNVSGVLFLSVSRKSRDSDIWPREPRGPVTSPEFKVSPGETKLRIVLEGVYTESATSGNDDETEIKRVLCMVGRAHLPVRDAGPLDWAKNSGRRGFAPLDTADDNIVLVLRYPKEPSLTNRAVLGEMRSTNDLSAAGYFDQGTMLAIRSERRCNSAATSCRCRDLGPFETDQDAEEDEVAGVGSLMMQDLHCDTGEEEEEAGIQRVSAVFRAVPSWEDPYTAARRSGLSGMTLSAEGAWNAQSPINVSAQLTAVGDTGITTSVMSLEGVYSPEEGLMQLVGCQVNRALEEEKDCSIEMRVEYPPTNTHYLSWSTAKVQIASMRDAGDPLHFDTTQLRSVPQYRKPRPDNVSRGIPDGVLCIVLLFAAIAAAGSQLRHLKAHADVAPYVSLVMLGVQALGFGVPLVMDIQALLGTATSRSEDVMASAMPTSSYMLNRMSWVSRSIYLVVNLLCVGAFVLTLWIDDKVRRARGHMLARSLLEPGDAKVFVYHCSVHLALFVLVLALNGQAMTVEQHVGLMHGPVPAVAVRLLPHVYEYVRPPPPVTFTHDENGNSSWSVFFPGGAGSLVMLSVSVLLVLVVYVQQRWNYAIVGRMGVAEQGKWQHTI